MCLAIPGRILEVEESVARVDFNGVERSALLDLLPDARPGDFVLVHAGFAIQRLDPREAAAVLALFEEAGTLLKESE